jgi:hypothetical protein
MPAPQAVCDLYSGELWEDGDGRNHRDPAPGASKCRKTAPRNEELSVFDRGERPDYEVFGAVIEFFKKYPD